MKTTIKAHMVDVVVAPNRFVSGYVDIFLVGEKDATGFVPSKSVSLGPDQVGALLFAIEQAAGAAGLARDRAEFGLVGNRESVVAMEDMLADSRVGL